MNYQALFVLLLLVSSCTAQAALGDDAQRVRSLLSNRCFACHGPDENQRQAGFRFDERESFLSEADSGSRPVMPGNASESELIRRLESRDSDERMPPPEFGEALSLEEIQLMRRWVDDGARLPQHWSFVAPLRPELPQIHAAGLKQEHAGWRHHPIDRFVLELQQQHGLQPSAEASRAELLRRLSLDLIGLPPTAEQIRRFEKDESPTAYDQEVDRLLASPAFGEHWARKWLDLARYADSAGYADDPARTIWAYRDWVINAINDNLSIEEFTIQQLAGDLLPHASVEQLVATAFHRNTITNNEGGTNDEEFRNVAIVDRVNTTLAVWMGVTMACAQCHTHKYDPFTQDEYFQLFAIFNQSQDADRKDESPLVEVFTAAQLRDQQRWQDRQQEINRTLNELTPDDFNQLAKWEAQLVEPQWHALKPSNMTSGDQSTLELHQDGHILVQPGSEVPDKNKLSIEFEMSASPGESFTGESITAIGLRTIPQQHLPEGGAGLAGGNFVLTGIKASIATRSRQAVAARYVRVELPGKEKFLSLAEVQAFSGDRNAASLGVASQSSIGFEGVPQRAIDGNTDGDYAQNSTTHTAASDDPWWEVDLTLDTTIDRIVIWNRTDGNIHRRLDGARLILLDAQRKPVFEQTISVAPKKSKEIAVTSREPITFEAALADYSQEDFPARAAIDAEPTSGWAVGGSVAESHLLTLVPNKPIRISEPAVLRIELEHNSPHAKHLLASFRFEATSSASAVDWAALSPELRSIHARPSVKRTDQEQSQLASFYRRELAASTAALRLESKQLEQKLESIKAESTVPIMRDLAADKQRETFVQIRGNYKTVANQVEPGTPATFHPIHLEKNQRLNRLEFAKWLVDRRNPLTARVWMNRMWESLFGTGIVQSSEDFGSQGDAPSHPQLLDWLACELMDSGWDHKQMLRLIVTSNVYRQSSRVTAEDLALDAENKWLARGPRIRLSAEMVRDQALAAAGLLSNTMYGPPVRPPQPDMGLKAAFGSDTDWKTSDGENRYRRGLYTTWRRSNPYPSMATFDAPSRETCTLRRDSTNTPLQALVTLNDPSFVEAAQALARRVVLYSSAGTDTPSRIAMAFEICTGRSPTTDELQALHQLEQEAQHQLRDDPQAAMKLATEPIGPIPQGADPIELAAFTALCNVLLNLDEVLMKR